MTASEEIKLQAKLLEWEAPKGARCQSQRLQYGRLYMDNERHSGGENISFLLHAQCLLA